MVGGGDRVRVSVSLEVPNCERARVLGDGGLMRMGSGHGLRQRNQVRFKLTYNSSCGSNPARNCI